MKATKPIKIVCGMIGIGVMLTQAELRAQINPVGNTITGTDASVAGGTGNTNAGDYSTIGGGTDNTITTDGSLSFLGGGDENYNAGVYSFLGAGYGNIMTVNGAASVIVGGFQNQMFDEYAFIGSGVANTIDTNGSHSFIGAGQNNYTDHQFTTISGGNYNTNSADFGTIVGGQLNLITGNFGGILGGHGALASHYGEYAHMNGGFAAKGDAQASEYVLRAATTSTNSTELFLDGSNARMTMVTNSTWSFEVLVAARSSNGDSGGFKTNGVVKDVNGTLTLLNGPITVPAIADELGGTVTLSADNVNRALVIKVNGNSSTNHWVATVHSTETIY